MRMKIRNITGLVLAALSAACINGCVEEMDVHVTDSEQISFTAVLPAMTRSGNVERSMTETLYEETRDWGWDAYMESPKTKGLPLMQLEGNAGVTAYQYDGEWKGTETSWSGLTNADYTFDGNALIGKMNRWSDVRTENLRVYAYAPYISAAGAGTISGSQTITVTVAGNVEDQIDIIAAENDVKVADAKGNSIPLTFDHILTAVRFRAGFECTVKYVSVSGIYGTGTYTLGSGWDMSGATPDAAYSVPPHSAHGQERTQKHQSRREEDAKKDLFLPFIHLAPSPSKIDLTVRFRTLAVFQHLLHHFPLVSALVKFHDHFQQHKIDRCALDTRGFLCRDLHLVSAICTVHVDPIGLFHIVISFYEHLNSCSNVL